MFKKKHSVIIQSKDHSLIFSTGSHSVSTHTELFPLSSVRKRNLYVPKAVTLLVKSQLSDETFSQTALKFIHDLRTETDRASLTAFHLFLDARFHFKLQNTFNI